MNLWPLQQVADLADAIVALGSDHPVVRELLELLEAGELPLSETAAVLKARCASAPVIATH